MATVRRSNRFNPNIDPALLQLLESVPYEGYDVELISGYRPKTPKNPRSRHGRGGAIDVELVDKKSGRRVPNYQSADAFKIYQDYANRVYQAAQQSNPELAQKLAWGGYFSGGKGKYGALDLMHFDTGGQQAGGDWQKGLYPQQASLWGLEPGGGIGSTGGGQVIPGAAPAAPPASQYALPRAPLPGGAVEMASAAGPGGPVEAAGGGAGSEATQVGANPYAAMLASAGGKKEPLRNRLGEALLDFGSQMATTPAAQAEVNIPPTPAAARVEQGPTPTINRQQVEMQRQQLAMALARLNQGTLVGV